MCKKELERGNVGRLDELVWKQAGTGKLSRVPLRGT